MSKTTHALCPVEGCERRATRRGMCEKHDWRNRRYGDPLKLRTKPTASEKYERQIDRNGPNGCWVWTGRLSVHGYGAMSVDSRPILLHRWAYENFHGPIPDGKMLDHLCRNRACSNPDHLEPVTSLVNNHRGMAPSFVIRRRGVCKNGHLLVPENVYVPAGKPTQRRCRICRAQNHKAYLERQAAKKAGIGG